MIDDGPSATAASAESEPVLELRGVQKRFGDHVAVRSMDLAIPTGSTYGLLGPNGAGKTTTIRMALDILRPDAGVVRLFGRPFDRAALDRIGYLPEERGVYKRMRVDRLLTFLAELKGVPRRESRSRIERWLERFELADRADSRVQELSKGMQQKLQFIGAILHEPELVILDEPFGGLDPVNQRVLREIITDLKRQGRTIIFSTHIIEHAERICDHVCIMAQGAKVVDGSIPRVKREHGGGYVAVAFEEWSDEAAKTLRDAPGVRAVREQGTDAEVSLDDGADAHAVLEHLVRRRLRLRRFERVEPSLEQIFVERVGAVGSAPPENAPTREVARV